MTTIQHMQQRLGGLWGSGRPGGPLLRALFPIEHIRTGNFMFAGAHQSQFDLILDIFNVKGTASGLVSNQRTHDTAGHLLDQLADPGAGRTLSARDRQKGFGHRDGNFGRLERDYGPVATDHTEVGDPYRVCCAGEAAERRFGR